MNSANFTLMLTNKQSGKRFRAATRFEHWCLRYDIKDELSLDEKIAVLNKFNPYYVFEVIPHEPYQTEWRFWYA